MDPTKGGFADAMEGNLCLSFSEEPCHELQDPAPAPEVADIFKPERYEHMARVLEAS